MAQQWQDWWNQAQYDLKHAAAARYPNGHEEGAPFEHYGPIHSELGIPSCRSHPRLRRSSAGRALRRSSMP